MPRTWVVGFLCPLSNLPHSTPSHLSVEPLVLGSTGVAGAESRAIGISVCPAAIISFALTTHLLFTFAPEIGQAAWGGGLRRRSGRSRRWWTWKWASFFPSTHWVDVVSYLVRAWLRARRRDWCWGRSGHLSASDFTVKQDEQTGECCSLLRTHQNTISAG